MARPFRQPALSNAAPSVGTDGFPACRPSAHARRAHGDTSCLHLQPSTVPKTPEPQLRQDGRSSGQTKGWPTRHAQRSLLPSSIPRYSTGSQRLAHHYAAPQEVWTLLPADPRLLQIPGIAIICMHTAHRFQPTALCRASVGLTLRAH